MQSKKELKRLLDVYKTRYENLKEIYNLACGEYDQKYIVLNRKELEDRLERCREDIKLYERKYKYCREHNDTFYMKSHLRTINRLQSEFETLRFVLRSGIKEE